MSYLLFTDIEDLGDASQTKNFISVNYESDQEEVESEYSDKLSRDGESNESGDCGVDSVESCCVTEEEIVALAEAAGLGFIEKAILEDDGGDTLH